MLRFSGLLGSDTPLATFSRLIIYPRAGKLMEVVVLKI